MYYTIFVFLPIVNHHHEPFHKLVLTSIHMVFMLLLNIFYVQFLTCYLDLHKEKPILYHLIRYYTWFNLALTIVFLSMSILHIESNVIFIVASLLTMPANIFVMIVVWRIKTFYARVAAYGITCAVVGELLCHLLIHLETNTYNLYNGNAYVPAQIGVMLDVFILGYGLSLRTAESDKKLVQILQENQQIIETERSRLAKDLHDGMGGLLSGIKLTLNSVAENVTEKNTLLFNKANNQLDIAIREMRRMAHNMMPEALLKFGLGEATQDFCDGINEGNLVKMKYIQIGSLQSLVKSTEIVLYRIIQELTTNALKHAIAKNIFIQITKHPLGISLTIEDDGKGFDTASSAGNGQGLKNVQSRIEYLKGSYDIKSEINIGTSINIEIPV